MNLLRQNGCPEGEVAEKAVVLEALQLAAEEKAARWRRNRVAKRGAQMALDLSMQNKVQRQRQPLSFVPPGDSSKERLGSVRTWPSRLTRP